MASTDTRSGFRLPWSPDRSHEEPDADVATDSAADPDAESGQAPDGGNDLAWPQTDLSAALGLTRTGQRPVESGDGSAPTEPQEPEPTVGMDTAVAPVRATAPRKPTKLMVDLTTAIRGTAEAARTQALAQVEIDVQQVVDGIRARSADGAVALKQQSEEDIADIREWSKAEIARIKEETETRIGDRRTTLGQELAGHAEAVERRIGEVHAEVSRFEASMDAYLERLGSEQDPARLATMAEEMPEPPTFDAWADLDTPDISLAAAPVVEETVEALADSARAFDPWLGPDSNNEVDGWVDAPVTEPDTAEPGAVLTDVAENVELLAEPAWTSGSGESADDGAARWAAGETPSGFPTGDAQEAGDPVDRGAIMAALEAAAEAVVAAESAAESADQAEAAADVAETAAGLLVGRAGSDDDDDPEAQAAMSARVDAGGYETESFADRLASLMPGHGEGQVGDEARTTQVVVSGLVSVASIASFKRHLGRVAGVQNVAVASGPEGEFLFNLTHRADLSFREAIPTMPGFAARVTSAGDGVVHVTARDPEAEG